MEMIQKVLKVVIGSKNEEVSVSLKSFKNEEVAVSLKSKRNAAMQWLHKIFCFLTKIFNI